MFTSAGGTLADDVGDDRIQVNHLAEFSRKEAIAIARRARDLNLRLEPPEVSTAPQQERRRSKGSGAPAGILLRHMNSTVDSIVFGRDLDGSDEAPIEQMRRAMDSGAPAPSSKTVLVSASPPSMEDLQALYALCGGNEAEVVVLLSRMWRLPREEIRPNVLSWLRCLPRPELPSRSRSAPAILPKAVHERLVSAAPVRRADAAEPKLPAASAPVSKFDLISVLHGMHAATARVRASLQWNGGRLGPDGEALSPRSDVLSLPHQPTFAPVLSVAELAALPEEEQLMEFAHDAALEAFMARARSQKHELTPAAKRTNRDRGRMRM